MPFPRLTAGRATLIAAVIALIPTFLAGRWTSSTTGPAPVPPVAPHVLLADLFGADPSGKPRATTVGLAENERTIASIIREANTSLRIVTIVGSSWLTSTHLKVFEEAIKRGVQVEVLLIDYTNNLTFEAVKRGADGYGRDFLTKAQYARALLDFARYYDLAQGNFKVGVWRHYPSTRFTIADERRVSFIVQPTLYAGKFAQPFHSTDRVVTDRFVDKWNLIRGSSRIFNTKEELLNFVKDNPGT